MAQASNPEATAALVKALGEGGPVRPGPPPRETAPDFQADLIRPDDLLALHVAGYNLKVAAGSGGPQLARIDDSKDALLVVTFPPQNIAETAYFETSNVKQPPLPPNIPQPQPDPPGTPSPPPLPSPPGAPGAALAHLSGFSRLVFRVAANAPMPTIPFTIAGLLDWSQYDLVVTPLADLPPHPGTQAIAGAPDIAPPGAQETAIELPYRLVLSPRSDVVWRHAATPVTHANRTELWHTRLGAMVRGRATDLSPNLTAPLRAIWSPDYIPRPPKSKQDPDLGLTDISPNDRHQIVVLTSAFHGYYALDGTPFVPRPVDAQMLMLSSLGGWLRSRGHWDPPQQITFIPWFGLAIEKVGATSRAAGPAAAAATNAAADAGAPTAFAKVGRRPPVARPAIPPPDRLIPIPGEQLDLSEWVHVAAQGRDHYVRIVYEGHLYPFGHRAALIKITERKFKDVTLWGGGTTPVAHLIQREYIVVREPEKTYRNQLSGNAEQVAGRKMPLVKVRLTTLVTPDLTQPLDKSILEIFPNPPPPPHDPFSFWIKVGTDGHDFQFHAIATDIEGNEIEFTTPLIFASLVDTPANYAAIRSAYAGSGERRACRVGKQKMSYAARNKADPSTDNTTLVTSALYFDTDEYNTPKMILGYGGYLPKLYKAAVHIPAIEQLLGGDTATTIALYDPYVTGGLDPHAGVFAQIVKDTASGTVPDALPVAFSSEKGGGVATPNLNISNLTRAHGPLAGDPAKAAVDSFEPSNFFGGLGGDLVPKLFGAIELTKLLPVGSAAKNAPKTQFTTVDNNDGSKSLLVTFDWTPDVSKADAGFAKFIPDDPINQPVVPTKLKIHGEVRKPLAVSTDPGTFSFNGQLTHFSLEILGAILLHFTSFRFNSTSGQKLDVAVDLNEKTPFEFEGDLAFVKDLSDFIPPGTFGDGPSIDLIVAPPAVHVGYGITLPPAAVGVFSLQNISLSAGLDLPLLSGKPVVDFAFAERAHPFLITVSLLGGGGFLHVQLDTEGMKLLEAALEFGANANINLGVASGGVHIMAGIYFSMQVKTGSGTVATLTGYLRMGGELSVLGLISVSLEFILSFTYSNGKATGTATLTVAVKVLFFSASVDITVQKQFGGSGSDPTFADLITASAWSEYAGAFA